MSAVADANGKVCTPDITEDGEAEVEAERGEVEKEVDGRRSCVRGPATLEGAAADAAVGFDVDALDGRTAPLNMKKKKSTRYTLACFTKKTSSILGFRCTHTNCHSGLLEHRLKQAPHQPLVFTHRSPTPSQCSASAGREHTERPSFRYGLSHTRSKVKACREEERREERTVGVVVL